MTQNPHPPSTDPLAPMPARWFGALAAAVLMLMAVVAFADVVLRMAGRPITGAYELTALLMGLLIYGGLPMVTAQDEHVRAGVLQMWTTAPAWLPGVLQRLRQALTALTFGYLAYALFDYMGRIEHDTAPYIEVPLAWVAAFGAASMVLSLLVSFWKKTSDSSSGSSV
jgi:TRAP-type C4-dicarboxylate transport system permease small subunit